MSEVRDYRGSFPGVKAVVFDGCALPFRDKSFDVIYSMGTIEHFDETEQAVSEMARVLKPGGCAIIGVPNRHDPFLHLDNVLLTPHIAGATVEVMQRHSELVTDNVVRFLEGKSLINVVNERFMPAH